MLNLRTLIHNLNDDEFDSFKDMLLETRAEKYLSLFSLYYLNESSDDEIMENLKVNNNAFYVMKSRLHVKLQEYLVDEIKSKDEFSNFNSMMDFLIYEENIDKSVAILTKLEKDYSTNGWTKQLLPVYDALKKLHVNSSKYDHYSNLVQESISELNTLELVDQKYNSVVNNVGHLLTSGMNQWIDVIDKDLKDLNEFKTQSSNPEVKLKNLIAQALCKLYVSRIPFNCHTEPIQDLLTDLKNLMGENQLRTDFEYYQPIYTMFTFKYNQIIGSVKGVKQSFDNWNSQLKVLVRNSKSTFAFLALKSKVEYYKEIEKEKFFVLENNVVDQCFSPNEEDIVGTISKQMYIASTNFLLGEYKKSTRAMVNLVNWVSFKRHPKAEIEAKLLLTLSFVMADKLEQGWNILRSVSRKTRELNTNNEFENAAKCCKLLRSYINSNHKDIEDKLESLIIQFERSNQDSSSLLPFLDLRTLLLKKDSIQRAA
jgi:hypothetical protein